MRFLRYFVIFCLALCIGVGRGSAADMTYEGRFKVVIEKTDDPVVGAVVSTNDRKLATTNDTGVAYIKTTGIDKDTQITVTAEGYETYTNKIGNAIGGNARVRLTRKKVFISGTVVDKKNPREPLLANVKHGDRVLVQTNFETGKFEGEISAIEPTSTLTITANGYKSVNIGADKLKDFKQIKLEPLSASAPQDANTANSANQECGVRGKKECRDSNAYYVCETNEDCAASNINVPARASTKKCASGLRKGYKICIADKCEDDYEPYQGYCKKKEKTETPVVTEPEPQQDDCAKSGGTAGNNDECICNGENLQQSEDKKTCVATTTKPKDEGPVVEEPVVENPVVENPVIVDPVEEEPVEKVQNETQCGGGELNGDGTCNCDVEDAHLVPTEDGSCDCADGYHRDEADVCVENTVEESDDATDTTVTTPETTTTETETTDPETDNTPQGPNKLEQATEDYKKAKENEQSLANRTLTAASTAATGLGLMTAASAYSEKRADEAAEQDMSAYLATFRCEYGRGQSVKAGNEEITLPGGNELLEYYSEYKNLADGLKNTKKALGMRPGIEQEVVYDKAESGLYKYASTGITDGAFISLSRALTDTEGKDAAEWNEQKDSSAKKLKGGAIAAGAGVAGGVVGDAAINTDMIQNIKDAFKK